jgi:hypothetical protein
MFGLENNGFLISLAISLLIALVTMLYFRQQLSTLDHKVNSMFSLMTSLTQELNSLSSLNMAQQLIQKDALDEGSEYEQEGSGNNLVVHNLDSDSRINVSDDSSEDEEDDSDDYDSEGEYDSENSLINLSGENEIKTLNMGSELHSSQETNIKIIEMSEEELNDGESGSEFDSDDAPPIKHLVTELIEHSIESNNYINDDVDSMDLPVETLVTDLTSDNVSIESITDLVEENEETVKKIEVPIDYSKVSVKALRDIVSSKNLANNVSKLKKQELINLLSD